MFNLLFWKKPKKNLLVLYLMSFFLALAGALPAYIQSSYLEDFVGLSSVTWFFVGANVFSIIAILFFPKLIKLIGNYFTTGVVTILFLISLVGFGLASHAISAFFFFVSMQLAINLIWINMDIFVENFSANNSTGKTRTIYFTVINLAWIISPSLSARIIDNYDYSGVFLSSACLLLPFLLIFLIAASKIKHNKEQKDANLKKNLKEMYQNKNLRGAFWLAMLLNVFFNATTVFVPIYLHQVLGFSWGELGLMFSIMLLPFLIFEIPAGIIADKYLGEKEIFALGYLIIIICLSFFFLSTSLSFWFWTILLFISRIGAALVEAMRETYFFKNVDASEVEKINIFRTAIPVGYLVGSLLSIITLSFFPMEYIFAITAIFLCSAFPFLAIIKDTK
jgi:MFS family permease